MKTIEDSKSEKAELGGVNIKELAKVLVVEINKYNELEYRKRVMSGAFLITVANTSDDDVALVLMPGSRNRKEPVGFDIKYSPAGIDKIIDFLSINNVILKGIKIDCFAESELASKQFEQVISIETENTFIMDKRSEICLTPSLYINENSYRDKVVTMGVKSQLYSYTKIETLLLKGCSATYTFFIEMPFYKTGVNCSVFSFFSNSH